MHVQNQVNVKKKSRSLLTLILVCPMRVIKVHRLEELRRDGRGLDIEVVLGEAHQEEEGCWREYLEHQGGHATDAQE